jgi:hypothetical protein
MYIPSPVLASLGGRPAKNHRKYRKLTWKSTTYEAAAKRRKKRKNPNMAKRTVTSAERLDLTAPALFSSEF